MKIRPAMQSDVPEIVRLLADDKLGSKREDFREPLPKRYWDAFKIIEKDRNQMLVVVESDGKIVGTLQLTFIQYLTYQGGIRAQIEAVRIHKEYRNHGLGKMLIQWAIGKARVNGAHLVQLTTDKLRPEALTFYEALGFKASHEGLKLSLKA